MTPQQVEAQTVILLYCWFGFLALAMLTYGYFQVKDRIRKNRQFKRRDHIMDQAALRIKEIQFLYEELWQKQEKNQHH